MPVDLQETRLPGIGSKFTLRLDAGGRLAIILHNDGKRELYYFRHAGDEEPQAVITLDDDEARQLGAVVGGAYERPKIVETVSWAASLGDRSENADYLYGKKRLREIDRRLSHLSKIMKAAKVVDPAQQKARDQVRFGATIELADEDDNRRTLTIVGDDETDAAAGRIGWSAPLSRALIGARVGDERIVRLPAGEKSYEVLDIRYPG